MDAERLQALLDGIPDAVQLEKLATSGDFKVAAIALIELAATASAFLRYKLETALAEATATANEPIVPKPAGR
jgi:hypothetical protein